jgi:hypothetical protein
MREPWSVMRATAVGVILALVYGLISTDNHPSGFRPISTAHELGQIAGALMTGAIAAASFAIIRNQILRCAMRPLPSSNSPA